MAVAEDLLFFGRPGSRGTRVVFDKGLTGGNATPFTAKTISAPYDPSEVAASWRLIGRLNKTAAYKAMIDLTKQVNDSFYANDTSRHNNSLSRFSLAFDYTAEIQKEHDPAATVAGTLRAEGTKEKVATFKTILVEEAKLWGVNYKVLVGVTIGNIVNSAATGVHPNTISWLSRVLGARHIERSAPSAKIYTKKSGKRKRGRSKKMRRGKIFKGKSGSRLGV